jgi:ATP-binding cassette, subfamily B, bacterial
VLTVAPRGFARRRGSRWHEIRRFLGVSRRVIAVILAASMAGALAEAAVLTLVVHIASDLSADAVPGLDLGPIEFSDIEPAILIWSAVALVVFRLLMQLVVASVPARIASDVQMDLRQRAFDAFRRASWPIQSEEKEGHLQQILGPEVNNATRSVLSAATGATATVNFVILVGAALVLDAVVAGIVVVVAVALFFLLRPISGLVRESSSDHVDAGLRFASGISESVRMAQELQTFGVGAVEQRRIDALAESLRRPFYRAQLLSRTVGPLYQSLMFCLVIGGLAVLYVADTTDVATLGAVVLLLVRALNHSQNGQNVYNALLEQLPYVDLVRDAIDRLAAGRTHDGGRPLPRIDDLRFENVSFAYVRSHPVIDDLSLALVPGEALGVVGPSGAGKSTVVQLLLRLRLPDAGRLMVNGEDAELFDRGDWFRRVAYLPQDARLLTASVADNIRFLRSWVDDAAVEAAARRAGVHDEILSWKDGYDAVIDERASTVSGGQRQRVCLARAFAGDPDLLVLDEPTSALDVDSERIVQASLRQRRSGMTVVVVAHRMSTLSDCDRIVVLDEGGVAALGRPEEVRRSNAFFRRGTSDEATTSPEP